MNVCVIIPAAGRSSRFGDSDKLSQDLGGRMLLLRTVEPFTKREDVRQIIVAGPPDDLDAFTERFGAQLGFHGVQIVAGGRAERWETVKAALAAVREDITHIAVHDAARPGVSEDLIARVFEAAGTRRAVIPTLPIAATVKRVSEAVEEAGEIDPIATAILGDAGGAKRIAARKVTETVDRRGLHEAQTPQVFERSLLLRAYEASDLEGATDDASLVERLGEEVWSVQGDPRNLKVTTPADLSLIRSILGMRPPAERPTHKRF